MLILTVVALWIDCFFWLDHQLKDIPTPSWSAIYIALTSPWLLPRFLATIKALFEAAKSLDSGARLAVAESCTRVALDRRDSRCLKTRDSGARRALRMIGELRSRSDLISSFYYQFQFPVMSFPLIAIPCDVIREIKELFDISDQLSYSLFGSITGL